MQSIVYPKEYNSIHPLFDEFDRFYQSTSERKTSKALFEPTFSNAFLSLEMLFNIYADTDYKFNYIDRIYPKLKLPIFNTKNIIVCASGGKDSVACILHYMKCNYNVYVFHVKGANTGYPDEYKALEQIADKLHIPLHITEIHYKGKRDWIEHPMKNIMIANMALQYGIENGITTKIAFGNFYTNYMKDNKEDFETTAGDQIEMWECYENIIEQIIPNLKMYISGRNYKTTMNMISKHLDILPYTLSCVSPQRFRKIWHDRTQAKYGIQLYDNRCGYCWKCALEYVWLSDHNIIECNKDYHRHCIDILIKQFRVYDDNALYNDILGYNKPRRIEVI